ncbi:MAG TPA: MTH1187 family thiamine-binding protein [Thermodesulfobacteriaceae bacterium]|nr:MTH1187 family thiamine-binding protein [Thermodesulfobacteriaceae bacterium]
MAIMEIGVVPIGTGSTSVGEFVVKMHEFLMEKGIPHELTDMGTNIEGDMGQLLEIAGALHEVPFSMGAQRVYTVIKIDDRRDREVHLGSKKESVQERTG